MDAVQRKVVNLVEGLSARFPSMSFMYGYDSTTRQHLVEVGPDFMYNSDEYMSAEGDIYDEWDKAYPDEDLVFVSTNDPYHKVTNALRIAAQKLRLPIYQLPQLAIQSFITVEGFEYQVPISAQAVFNDFAGGCIEMPTEAVRVNPVFEQQLVGAGEYNYTMAA